MPVERRGQAIAFEIGSTGNGRNPVFEGRRQPSRGGTSRMTRECQVRICEGLGVAQIRRIRQEENAPQVQRRLLRPAYSVSDMKEGLEGARHESLAAFFNHPRPSQEIDNLLGIADKNFLKDESFLRCDPSPLQ